VAANVINPADRPRRANVPREVPAPAPEAAPEAAAAPAPPPVPAPTPAPERRPRRPVVEVGPRSSWSLFSLLDRVTSVDGLFREGLPVRFLPHLLFVMLLTLLYIGNTHYGNRMNRNIQRLKQETEDLRADYTTLKSDYMEASKQSEVARKVAAFGLVESSSPPFRIGVPAGHLDAAELELMPVLTADTLAARAARDSATAQRADALAGRRRISASAADSGPEIIAPPQAFSGDTAVLEANGLRSALPKLRPAASAGLGRRPAAGLSKTGPGSNKRNNVFTAQKSITTPKLKLPESQAAKGKQSKKPGKLTPSAR